MRLASRELLSRLGSGESIASVCASAGISRSEFDSWWQRETAARVPPATGACRAGVQGSVRIERDEWGIPHILAENDHDLFFGFGYATAQDRLFQLDYLRRRALGRLAEILGPEGIELDLVARTVGLHLTPAAEWESLPDETRQLIGAFSSGINAHIAAARDNLPIEFDLLGYRPEPWQPQDCLAIAGEFRWYLTGRFPVIVIPELAKRTLGTGSAYDAFLKGEADAEAILPAGSYPRTAAGSEPVGVSVNDPQEGHGSNNWVISGARSVTGKPLVASDPHIAFAAVSCWHEVHLCGGSFNVSGIAYAGMPAVMFGRNEHVAWGITNNICSVRDLYQEKTDPAHPGTFQYNGRWEPARERTEVIQVKGSEPLCKTIRLSRNGPIVDDILPSPARETGPVSLRWLGSTPCGWLTALLGMDRAKTGDELRRATEPWLVPTFCVVYADVAGNIGYQCTGRIPIRNVRERGYRPGWDPAHQWTGVIPFEGMPNLTNPPRGWIGSANNRVAADDFPFPLAGTWASGYRAVRIRQLLEAQPRFRRDDFVRMHQDAVSLRAVEFLPQLLCVLRESPAANPKHFANPAALHQYLSALEHLAVWDCRMEPDRVAASIFNVFFVQWCQAIADRRFAGEAAALVAAAVGGLACELLSGDTPGWFGTSTSPGDNPREAAIVQAFRAALEYLTGRFGPDPLSWSWGRMHTLQQKHVLTTRGDLAQLLDRGGVPVRGDFLTVCNTGQAPDYSAPTGAGYRLIADLADPQGGLWAVDAGSESGHPGSPHYADQLVDWVTARYHYLPLTRGTLSTSAGGTLLIEPAPA